jgi:uncharacterized MAPEG superfamily protein
MPPLALAVSLLAAVTLPGAALPDAASAAAGGAFAWSLVLSGAVVMASLIPLGAGRSQANFTPADLAAPRAMFERLPGWGKRASWAHQNSFEAFTLHAPACLLCLLVAPALMTTSPWTAVAALLHPALRLGYLGAYVANLPPLRSLCWAGGILTTALLYGEGLRAVLRS